LNQLNLEKRKLKKDSYLLCLSFVQRLKRGDLFDSLLAPTLKSLFFPARKKTVSAETLLWFDLSFVSPVSLDTYGEENLCERSNIMIVKEKNNKNFNWWRKYLSCTVLRTYVGKSLTENDHWKKPYFSKFWQHAPTYWEFYEESLVAYFEFR
jgi:hypothetical protein